MGDVGPGSVELYFLAFETDGKIKEKFDKGGIDINAVPMREWTYQLPYTTLEIRSSPKSNFSEDESARKAYLVQEKLVPEAVQPQKLINLKDFVAENEEEETAPFVSMSLIVPRAKFEEVRK